MYNMVTATIITLDCDTMQYSQICGTCGFTNIKFVAMQLSDDLLRNQRLSRACIVHLVIKKNNWSYVKTMSCSGSHLGITINIKNTKFVKDLPMIDAQFRFNQCNSFREEYISVFSPYGSVLIL